MTNSFPPKAVGLWQRGHARGLQMVGGLHDLNGARYLPAATMFALTLTLSATAHAQAFQGGVQASTMLNSICTFILGAFGQTLAVLGIIGIGMSWMFGRASLGLVAGVIGGIIIMFAAGFIGSTLTGGGGAGGAGG